MCWLCPLALPKSCRDRIIRWLVLLIASPRRLGQRVDGSALAGGRPPCEPREANPPLTQAFRANILSKRFGTWQAGEKTSLSAIIAPATAALLRRLLNLDGEV
jgi:hypothetical protein